MKAFLGMGLLGSNFVRAMRDKGIEVNVWNRTFARAQALKETGAKAFEDVAEAVKGADTVHIVVKDDASVDEVLAKALPGLSPGTVIIDHTTTSKDGAIARTGAWKAKGFTYLHAPVFMGPSNARDGSGYMMVSGDQAVIAQKQEELSGMTGKLLNFGPEEGKAAAIKLLGNLFLISMTTGVSDMLALAKVFGVPPTDLLSLFEAWNPGTALPARLKRLANGSYEQPSWELAMARKDAGLMISAVEQGGGHFAAIPAIAAEMDKFIAEGFGNYDWSVIAKNNV